MYKKHFFLFLCLVSVLTVSASAQKLPTTVIIVRHAEKETGDKSNLDPSLSETGARRAQDLVRLAEDANVTAIYTTQFKRAKETAQPLADKLSIPITATTVNAENFNNYSSEMAKEILTKYSGQTVLVISHTNTIPQLIQALGGKLPPPIDDATEFDRVFVVVVPESGAPKIIKARYGDE